MIELYGMSSPNVLKVAIMLEEIGKEYEVRHVAVMQGKGKQPEFLALNPLGKVPVIVDYDGPNPEQPIFESGAILIYLAETYAAQLLAKDGAARWEALKWVMAQMSLAGPMLGQLNHFQLVESQAETYAYQRYRDQAAFVYQVFNRRLQENTWLAGEAYSIADIAMYPWAGYLKRHGFKEADFPHLIAWRDRIDARPAVAAALRVFAQFGRKDHESRAEATAADMDSFFNRSSPGPAVDLDTYTALGPMTSAKP